MSFRTEHFGIKKFFSGWLEQNSGRGIIELVNEALDGVDEALLREKFASGGLLPEKVSLQFEGHSEREHIASYDSNDTIVERSGIVVLSKASSLAIMRLDDPGDEDEGKTLTIVAFTARPHTVIVGGGLCGGELNTLNFSGASGDMAIVLALRGKWCLKPSVGVTAATV